MEYELWMFNRNTYWYSFVFSARCLYKGVEYAQGQRWDDGCDYTCVCTDAMTGKYTCDEKYVLIFIKKTLQKLSQALN